MAEAPATQTNLPFNELARYAMFAPVPGVEGGKKARLVWVVRDNNPRITVYTNVQGDSAYGIINAGLTPEILYVLLDLLEEVIKGEKGEKRVIECLTSPKQEDGSYGPKQPTSSVWVGKDANGVVWISVVSANQDRPKIKFEFKVYEYYRLLKSDGVPITEAESSELWALASVRALRLIFANLTSGFRPRVQAPSGSKPSYGGGANAVLDDDLPF
jgi:hypothetical protein